MITLKDDQLRVLDSLREFFRIAARTRSPEQAFQEVISKNSRSILPYIPVQCAGLASHMPYICLRVPTGGGKTLLACHAIGSAMQDFLRAERAVVLWLVPSNTILDQTAEALRDPRHPYRRALDMACGAVEMVREAEKAFGGKGETRMPSPYEQQLDFCVPLLCVAEGDELFEFEGTFLLEHPWKLSEKDATLSINDNPLVRPAGRSGVLDVNAKGGLQTEVRDSRLEDFVCTLHQQVLALHGPGEWTQEALIAWLDRRIDHRDIPMGESAEFLRKVIRGLMAQHEITDISTLALDRFRLLAQG